jgi:hypothetical protein
VTHKFATYFILAVGALSLSALPAVAGPATCGGGEVVVTGTVCSLGDLTFTFDLVSFAPGSPSDVLQLTTPYTGISGDDYVLDFQDGPSVTDLQVDYTVTSTSTNIIGVDNSYGPTGLAQSLVEDVYASEVDGAGSDLLATVNNTTGDLTFASLPSAVSSVYIEKDFTNPSSVFTDSIVATPEPSSFGLLLIAAFGIAAASRKFRRA